LIHDLETRHLADLRFAEVSRALGRFHLPISSVARRFITAPRWLAPANARRLPCFTVLVIN
jgi:hypothetical protein